MLHYARLHHDFEEPTATIIIIIKRTKEIILNVTNAHPQIKQSPQEQGHDNFVILELLTHEYMRRTVTKTFHNDMKERLVYKSVSSSKQ